MIGISAGDSIAFSTSRGSFIGRVLSSDAGCIRPLRVQYSSTLGKHIERFSESEFISVRRV